MNKVLKKIKILIHINNNSIIYYLIIIIITISILIIVYGYKTFFNLNIPISYGGDASYTALIINNIIENGWIYNYDRIGAPFKTEFYDFPLFDSFHLFLIKIIVAFFPNWAISSNLYYILTHILVTFTAVFILRKLGFSYFSSAAGALIFNFIPYHFIRGVPHIFLSGYYMIPISIYICIKIFNYKNDFKFNKKIIFSLIIIGMTGIYYAYFTCIFILFTWLYNIIESKGINKKIIFSSFGSIGIIIFSGLVNIIPNLIYYLNNNINQHILLNRGNQSVVNLGDAGITILQLILPSAWHRNSFFSNIRNVYNKNTIILQENIHTNLGIFLSIGFIILLIILITNIKENNIKYVSILNIFTILFVTVGGFSGIILLYFFNAIRAYNRIVVFIAFLSAIAITWLFNNIELRIKNKLGGGGNNNIHYSYFYYDLRSNLACYVRKVKWII